MESITVKVKNNAFLYIDCDDKGILHELSEAFTFFVPNYKFTPQFRNKLWDGKIRLFNMRDQSIYSGLFGYVKAFCIERNIELISILKEPPSKYNLPGMDYPDDISWIKNIPIPWIPKDYQLEAIKHGLRTRSGLLVSPTASGKSLIIYLLMRYFLATNEDKVLIIVPTTSLVKQMYGDFCQYADNDDDWFATENCHEIMAGLYKYHNTKRVYISTWQSIYQQQKVYFQQFGMVIGDEAHNFKAKSLTSILTKCTEARYRFGLTGTLDGTQTHKLVLEGLFGPHKNITTSKALIDRGDLANLSIDIILLKHKEESCKEVNGMKYQEEVDYIVTCEARNKFIKNLALDQKGNTLILFQYVEKHGEPLFRMIDEAVKGIWKMGKRKVFFVSGKVPADIREEIRAITEKEKDAILVCSYGTFSTGVNIVNLNNIIFASPSKSQIRVLQSIGRGLRKTDKDTKLYDIADDLHWKSKKNYTLNHSRNRVEIYAKEKFKFKIHEVKLL
jgi:superfamily II DNA or RNA helicase|tara:strand:- start:3473 stop:4978 length:1506 start_codon:yes stop_codon:yes gene_type:complete